MHRLSSHSPFADQPGPERDAKLKAYLADEIVKLERMLDGIEASKAAGIPTVVVSLATLVWSPQHADAALNRWAPQLQLSGKRAPSAGRSKVVPDFGVIHPPASAGYAVATRRCGFEGPEYALMATDLFKRLVAVSNALRAHELLAGGGELREAERL